jgi:hypothetical protein
MCEISYMSVQRDVASGTGYAYVSRMSRSEKRLFQRDFLRIALVWSFVRNAFAKSLTRNAYVFLARVSVDRRVGITVLAFLEPRPQIRRPNRPQPSSGSQIAGRARRGVSFAWARSIGVPGHRASCGQRS